jgi:hypothetical protein
MLGRDRKPIYRWLKRGVLQEVKVLRAIGRLRRSSGCSGERDKSKAK